MRWVEDADVVECSKVGAGSDNPRMTDQIRSLHKQSVRAAQIVRIKPSYEVPTSKTHPGISRCCEAAVGLVMVDNSIEKRCNRVSGIVGRAIVNEYNLEIWVVLGQNTFQGQCYVLGAIVPWYYNRHERRLHHPTSVARISQGLVPIFKNAIA